MADDKPDKPDKPDQAPKPEQAVKPEQAAKPDPAFTPEQAAKPEPVESPQPVTPTPMPKPKTPNLALRRLKAGFKPSRGQAIVAVVLALVACTAVVQVRVNRADDGYQNARREDLIAILDGLGQNTRRLESEIAALEGRKNT